MALFDVELGLPAAAPPCIAPVTAHQFQACLNLRCFVSRLPYLQLGILGHSHLQLACKQSPGGSQQCRLTHA